MISMCCNLWIVVRSHILNSWYNFNFRTKATIESEDGTIEDGECKDGMFKSFNFGNEHFANSSFKMPYIKIEDSKKIVVKNLVSQKIEIDITDQHYCVSSNI